MAVGEDSDGRSRVSRRAFLRTSAMTAGATMIEAAIGELQAAEADGAPRVGPGPVAIILKVNGRDHALEIEPQATLAEVLRGALGLTGTKIACNRGACSACTVWLDGVPTLACMMLALEVGGRAVTTIEGLAQGETLHPVQEAFIDHDALQCGFCTPGMVMATAALLAHTPDPSVADVHDAISGHFCRCGTYPHVVAATLAAAKARRT